MADHMVVLMSGSFEIDRCYVEWGFAQDRIYNISQVAFAATGPEHHATEIRCIWRRNIWHRCPVDFDCTDNQFVVIQPGCLNMLLEPTGKWHCTVTNVRADDP